VKFFNIDFHISVIADIRSVLGELGHTVESLSLSNHTWVFGRNKDRVLGLDGMSDTAFGERECEVFFKLEGKRLDEYKGFIVTHTPCLAGLYERTGKPVICVISTRYDGFCQTPESRLWLKDVLQRMHRSGQLLLLANNAYDAWHLERSVGLIPRVVPSICDYTGVKWEGGRTSPFFHGRVDCCGLRRMPFGHSWQDVADAECCVIIPYNVSQMSIFEVHSMGMPMLMPSVKWVLEHPESLSELRYSGQPDPAEIAAAVALSDWHSGELPGVTFFDSIEKVPGMIARKIPPVHGSACRKERVLELWRQVCEQVKQG
jgi:hypothetical protein